VYQRRLRGLPPREHPDAVPAPPVEEIKPSEAIASPIQKGIPYFSYMTGRTVPAMVGAGVTGGGALGTMLGAGLGQFITEYGPRFRENLEAGLQEDEALRTALQSSGVTAGATALAFGVPLTVLKQVLLQPTIAGAETVIQNYLAGKPPEQAFEGAGEALIGGAAGAAPIVAFRGARRILRGRRAPEAEPRPEVEPEAPPAEPPPVEPEAPPARPPAVEEVRPPAGEPPSRPPADVDLFDWAISGGEGEPPTAAPPVQVAAAVPRVVPRVEPPRVEPPRPPAGPPRVEPPPAAPAEPPRARERIPEIPPEEEVPPAPPEARGRVPEIPGNFVDVGEPPPWVTERIPEERAIPPEPPRVTAEPAPPELGEVQPEKRQSLLDYIREQGGISSKDPLIGDVRSIIGGQVSPLIRKGGKGLDRLLEGAVEAGYIEDPGFRGGGERTSTIRDLLDALDKDLRARAAKQPEQRVWARGEETRAERTPSDYELEIEREAGSVRDALAKAGIRGEGVDTDALYRAAESLYRREARTPLEAYDRAALEVAERDYAQRTGMREGREEVYPAGEPGAGSRVEKALPAPRAEPSGARPARKPARQEVPAEDLAHLQDVFRGKVGEGVNALDSIPLRTVLKELDIRHLGDVPAAVARFVSNRLAQVAGDTPVHFITDADMARYFPGRKGPVGGLWIEATDRAGNRRPLILVNADIAAEPRYGVHTVLHEGTHAAAYNNLERNPKLKRAIRLIMDEMAKRVERPEKVYAFTNEHEFLSEAFGNPDMQRVLAQVPTPPSLARALGHTGRGPLGTLWDSFVETVRRLTGLPAGAKSMLETIVRVGEQATRREAVQGEMFRRRTEAAMRKPEEEPGAEGKPQLVLPGAEQRPGAALQRRAEAPLKPRAEQKPMDFGLFGDERTQGDLFGGRDIKSKPLIVDAANEALSEKLRIRTYPTLAKMMGAAGRLIPEGAPAWMRNATELRVKTQDAFLRWRRAAEQWIRDNPGKVLPDWANPYQAEALSHGKIAARKAGAEEKYTIPLAKAVNALGKNGYKEFGEYAQAKHAPERNRELRRINPNLLDPAGMSDAEAQAILQRVARDPRRAKFDAAYTALRNMIDGTLDGMVRDGLVPASVAAAWRARWPDYVPMRHSEIGDMLGIGRGVDIRGKESQQAFGRLSRADNPIQFAIMQMDRAVTRGERNKVGEAVSNFVERAITSDPANRDLFSTTEKPTKLELDPSTGQVREIVDPNWRNDPAIYIWKQNGVERHVFFKGEYGGQLIRALKNMELAQANDIVLAMAWTTRQLARLNTSLNPEFVISNFIRDAGEAFVNLPTEQQAALVSSFRKHLIPSLKGAWQGQVTLGGRHAQWYREFVQEGGKIGYSWAETAEQHSVNFQKMLKRMDSGAVNTIKDMKDFVVNGIDRINTTVENATRLAVYIAARENGISKPKAAYMAREATVNFNRRGELKGLNAAFMFFNAGLQGTVRGVQALKSSPRARKAAAAVAASGAALTTYNIFAGGTDSDGRSLYSKIPKWERELNFIFMNPNGSGSYIKIPKPFFYGMFAGIGDHMAQFVFEHGDAAKAASGIFWEAVKAVDPLGQDEGWAHFVPTLAKPFAQLALNQNPWGAPIHPEEQPWSKYVSKSEGFTFRGTSETAKWAARTLNQLGGGDKKTPGGINVGVGTISTDVHPETLSYLTGFLTGGLGRFAMNALGTVTRLYNGQEWAPEKTPFARRFYGEAPQPGANRALYAEQRKEVEAAAQRKTPGPEMSAAPAFTQAQKANKELYQQMDAIQKNEKLSTAEKDRRVKALEQQQLNNMLQARRVLERHRARAEQRAPAF
jgi:hypothetical protein